MRSYLIQSLLAVASLLNATLRAEESQYQFNPTGWGASVPTPCVVSPAIVSPLQKVVSLRGDWDFKQDTDYGQALLEGKASLPMDFWNDKLTLQVPGCWEAQGVGDPGMSETWDCTWDCNPRPLDHIYMGGAFYRKTLNIPEDWKDSQVWLKIGGVRTEAAFWVNGCPIGVINNYCGTYKFDVTSAIVPGRSVEILAYVRNDLPSRKGQMCDFHRFGGLYRDVELEATPLTWLDDVWVQGQISQSGKTPLSATNTRIAKVHATIKTTLAQEDATLSIKIKTLDGQVVASKTLDLVVPYNADQIEPEETIVDIPVEDVTLWTPEKPTLYVAEVELHNKSDDTRHGWCERFGFRKIEVVGKRFYLNGVPYFIRGYGETFIYPLTLISPADRDAHRKNFAVIKECGFNETRMHTHCELPEYFEAADEAGVLLQPELPYYQEKTTEAFEYDPLRDIAELYRHYRRYTSFAFYCAGNEGGFDRDINLALRQWVHDHDPDRPYQLQDGGFNTPEVSDFFTGPINVWTPGEFDDLPYPFVAHEYLNLTIKLDPRLEPLFTGAIPSPVSMKEYEEQLAALGLNRSWGDACIRAAGMLQAFWQKEGVEAARRDPECDGYCFWNFVDQMVVQGPAYTSQGYLNAFYQIKDGGMTPKEFALFNSPTAILPEFHSTSDIFVSGEVVPLDLWIATYEDRPLTATEIDWRLDDVKINETLCSGRASIKPLAIGEVRKAAVVNVEIPELQRPAELKLTVKIVGTDVENERSIWAFPKRAPKSLKNYVVDPEFYDFFAERYTDVVKYSPADKDNEDKILIAPYESESFRQAIFAGRKILAIREGAGNSNTNLGWWSFGSQLGTAFANSPAFGDFPHNGAMIPSLWFRMMTDDPLEISSAVGEYEPLALGELVDDYSLYVGEKKDGNAKVLATFGLNLLQDLPETLALLDAFVAYVDSDAFDPQ